MSLRRYGANQDYANMIGQDYKCVRCNRKVEGKELDMRQQMKCPHCGYRVLRKIRPQIVKRVRAI